MGRFLLGVVIGVSLVAGGVFVYFTTGMAPAAATAAPMPFEKYFAGAALHARIRREAPKDAPPQIPATPENLLAGAIVYKKNCAFCHGLPDSDPSREGRGMYPHAPRVCRPYRNTQISGFHGAGRVYGISQAYQKRPLRQVHG